MNIKDAKLQIKNAMIAYFTKDDSGEYIMPTHKQRPVFLMGPPGIGKTAIMEQVASEMGVGLISYSMTHHTRQSALGLPFIVHKNYNGMEYDISEYTMSEIIASVYDLMEQTGVKEGILFLDEINCVSETLAPVMLQFLQYKVFGRHQVPEGWIVITAGNPPEYNNSVREFDIVTWDRLKRVDIEPDFAVWKEYALEANVHPAVLTYLEIRSSDFYRVESTVDGKSFVTARGWEDLSQMIRLYERNGLTVGVKLIGQYLQNKKIAREFAQYYDLFRKYRSDYQVDTILAGKASQEIKERAMAAKFDERLSLISLMMDAITADLSSVMEQNAMLTELMAALKEYRLAIVKPKADVREAFSVLIEKKRQALAVGKKSGAMSGKDQRIQRLLIECMKKQTPLLQDAADAASAFAALKKGFDARVNAVKKSAEEAGKHLENLFLFAELVWNDGQEMLIITTEVTTRKDCASFIAKFGSKEYFRHNKDLLLYERQGEIEDALKELKLN